jgi:asparagine synthase (glutamine-hydrolysing)
MNNLDYDESEKAKNIARYLDTNHNEYRLGTDDVKNSLPIMHNIYDEPFADSSQIPTYILSKFASKKIKVALSGDGGDELFGGYVRHIWSKKILQLINFFPLIIRKKFGQLLLNLNYNSVIKIEKILNIFISNQSKLVQLDKKLNKFGKILSSSTNISDFYFTLISVWPNMLNDKSEVDYVKFISNQSSRQQSKEDIMWLDVDNYLHDDVLCKLDRAAMSNSLETRVPFLDKDVYDISKSFSFNEKINKGVGKIPLRDLMKKYFPKNTVDQPKMGFGIPLNNWMRNDLKIWVDDILNSEFVKNQEYYNQKTLLYYWNEHCTKGKNYGESLWNALIFLNWLKDNNGNH